MAFEEFLSKVYPSINESETTAIKSNRKSKSGKSYVSRKKLLFFLLFIFVVGFVLYKFNLSERLKNSDKLFVNTDMPTQEKIADGAWILKNHSPIKQTLANVKVNTNLKENKKAVDMANGKWKIDNSKSEEIYRWSVSLPSGTIFAFGLQDEKGIKPVVKVTNKDGYFVRYYPYNLKAQNANLKTTNQNLELKNSNEAIEQFNHLSYVNPKVKGNVIEWEIYRGITARYAMQSDRVKADYIIDKESNFKNQNSDGDYSLDFVVDHNSEIEGVLLPKGEISWFEKPIEGEDTGKPKEIFLFPEPVANDKNSKDFEKVSYELENINNGLSILEIAIDKEDLKNAAYPIVIDPVVVDSANVVSTATAYGNSRNLLRDPWGNLFVVYQGGAAVVDTIAYKNYNSTTWTAVDDTGGFEYPINTMDFDSNYNIHMASELVPIAGSNELDYTSVNVTRNGNNLVTGLSFDVSGYIVSVSGKDHRPTLIVANKGMGANAEQLVAAVIVNTTSGGTRRGEIRVSTCQHLSTSANPCNDAVSSQDDWMNASHELNQSGTCSDSATAGAAGPSDSVTCKGGTDAIFQLTGAAAHHDHHGQLIQIPGRPRRSPEAAVLDLNSSQSNITNTIDGSTSTSQHLGGLTTTDYIYVGDSVRFSKLAVDMNSAADGNVNASTFTTAQYCSAESGGSCTSWSNLSNMVDYTASAAAFSDDGALLFDEPENWVTSSVNGNTGKYWIRIRPSAAFDSTVKVREFYVTDRNARALMVVGGDSLSQDMRVAYIPWDEINQDRWENRPDNPGSGWREDAGGTSSAINPNGAEWDSWVAFPLSVAIDSINNNIYVMAESTTGLAGDTKVYTIGNNKDLTITANWTDAAFPAITEATDVHFSLTTDGQDLYAFYSGNPGTDDLVWVKCSPQNAGVGNRCDNASDWSSASTLVTVAGNNPHYYQAVVSKVSGDTTAIDLVYTNATTPAVEYERHYVDMGYAQQTLRNSADDGTARDCESGTDDQNIVDSLLYLGTAGGDPQCDASANASYNPGMRFQGVNIARGAKIASAYLDFYVTDDGPADGLPFTIYGEDADNSSAYSSLTNCTAGVNCTGIVTERTRTTNSASYNINFSHNRFRLDVTDIIQEIVCRGASEAVPCVGDFYNNSGSWSPHNALSLLLIATDAKSVVDYVTIQTADGGAAVPLGPTLQINLGSSTYDYSMGSATQLATGSGSFVNLDHPLATSSGELGALTADDSNYASIAATTNYASSSAQPAFMFKVNNTNNNNTYNINASVVARSSTPTTSKPIYLQVYRAGSTNNWETVARNNSSASDTDITLNAITISSSVDEYYHSNSPGGTCDATGNDCWVYFRLYQDAPTTLQNQILSVDYVNVSFSSAAAPAVTPPSSVIRGGVIIRGGSTIR